MFVFVEFCLLCFIYLLCVFVLLRLIGLKLLVLCCFCSSMFYYFVWRLDVLDVCCIDFDYVACCVRILVVVYMTVFAMRIFCWFCCLDYCLGVVCSFSFLLWFYLFWFEFGLAFTSVFLDCDILCLLVRIVTCVLICLVLSCIVAGLKRWL